jgi:hypothetical protein
METLKPLQSQRNGNDSGFAHLGTAIELCIRTIVLFPWWNQ